MPICKSLKRDGLYEVRSTISTSREVRVIFCIHDHCMILLHAFIKKSQKTPEQDLWLAIQRKKEVKNA